MGELVSLFDLGILAKRYWKMIVVLVVAGGIARSCLLDIKLRG